MKSNRIEVISRMEKLHLLRRIILQKATADLEIHFGQLPILEYVRKNDGCTQMELAEKMLVSPASIAVSTKRMKQEGLLEKHVDENNLRQNRLTVTEKGRRVSAQCRRVFDEADTRMFKDFKEEEISALLASLDKMLFNITGKDTEHFDLFTLASLERQIEVEKIKNYQKHSKKHSHKHGTEGEK